MFNLLEVHFIFINPLGSTRQIDFFFFFILYFIGASVAGSSIVHVFAQPNKCSVLTQKKKKMKTPLTTQTASTIVTMISLKRIYISKCLWQTEICPGVAVAK